MVSPDDESPPVVPPPSAPVLLAGAQPARATAAESAAAAATAARRGVDVNFTGPPCSEMDCMQSVYDMRHTTHQSAGMSTKRCCGLSATPEDAAEHSVRERYGGGDGEHGSEHGIQREQQRPAHQQSGEEHGGDDAHADAHERIEAAFETGRVERDGALVDARDDAVDALG